MNKEHESKLNYHEEENAMVTDLDDLKAVSYTHLTLPTICSV